MTAHVPRTEAPSVVVTEECCYVAVSRHGNNNWSDAVVQRAGEWSENKHVRREWAIFKYKKMCGFPCTCSSQRGGAQPHGQKRFSSTTSNAQSTATDPGWDPDMRRNVPTGPLLAPQPNVQEKILSRRRTPRQEKEGDILHTYTNSSDGVARRTTHVD